jgi:Lysozyme like domain
VSTYYSYGQLEWLWEQAGGPSSVAPLAAAIALAESGGNPLAAYPGTTVAPGQGSNTDATGLWQILGVPAGFTPAQLTDPLANAQMAVAKYEGAGNSFSPWQTYTEGTYSVQNGVTPVPIPGITSANSPATGGSSTSTAGSGSSVQTDSDPLGWAIGETSGEFGWFGPLITGVTGTGSSIGDVATAISGLVRGWTKFLELFLMLFRPEFWLRVGAFLFGLVSLGAAVYFLKEAL